MHEILIVSYRTQKFLLFIFNFPYFLSNSSNEWLALTEATIEKIIEERVKKEFYEIRFLKKKMIYCIVLLTPFVRGKRCSMRAYKIKGKYRKLTC